MSPDAKMIDVDTREDFDVVVVRALDLYSEHYGDNGYSIAYRIGDDGWVISLCRSTARVTSCASGFCILRNRTKILRARVAKFVLAGHGRPRYA